MVSRRDISLLSELTKASALVFLHVFPTGFSKEQAIGTRWAHPSSEIVVGASDDRPPQTAAEVVVDVFHDSTEILFTDF